MTEGTVTFNIQYSSATHSLCVNTNYRAIPKVDGKGLRTGPMGRKGRKEYGNEKKVKGIRIRTKM